MGLRSELEFKIFLPPRPFFPLPDGSNVFRHAVSSRGAHRVEPQRLQLLHRLRINTSEMRRSSSALLKACVSDKAVDSLQRHAWLRRVSMLLSSQRLRHFFLIFFQMSELLPCWLAAASHSSSVASNHSCYQSHRPPTRAPAGPEERKSRSQGGTSVRTGFGARDSDEGAAPSCFNGSLPGRTAVHDTGAVFLLCTDHRAPL